MTLTEWLDENDPGPNVEWQKAGRVHDWRNYVPQKLREGWLFLSPTERAIVSIMAEEQAGNESWD
jgi:hypothetical protein